MAEESSPNTEALIWNIKTWRLRTARFNNIRTLVSPKQGLSCASNRTANSQMCPQSPAPPATPLLFEDVHHSRLLKWWSSAWIVSAACLHLPRPSRFLDIKVAQIHLQQFTPGHAYFQHRTTRTMAPPYLCYFLQHGPYTPLELEPLNCCKNTVMAQGARTKAQNLLSLQILSWNRVTSASPPPGCL